MTMVGKTITLDLLPSRIIRVSGDITQNYAAIESGVNFWQVNDAAGNRVAMATSTMDIGRKVARLEGITAPKIVISED